MMLDAGAAGRVILVLLQQILESDVSQKLAGVSSMSRRCELMCDWGIFCIIMIFVGKVCLLGGCYGSIQVFV